MKIAGYLLFLAGTAAAAIIAASPRPLSACSLAAAAVGAAGALMVRFHGRCSAADRAAADRNLPAVMFRDIASELVAAVSALRRRWENGLSGDGERIRGTEEIMRICGRFVDLQYALADSIGPDRAGQVISAFSAGERYVHRAWSAQVDNCGPEALASLRASESHFIQTLSILESGHGTEHREG